ncbi:MAG: endonuclease III [Dehalococcoidia bacterium]|jgi:endonuclease-3|nr:endonuclease III [Dehalococcoidia bacterium]
MTTIPEAAATLSWRDTVRVDDEVLDAVLSRLDETYGPRVFESRGRPVDVLIETVLSQNTSDVNSHRAFESLLARFGTLEAVAAAPVAEIEDAIRFAGLSRIKSVRIREMLERLIRENGSLELSFLAGMKLDEARAYLMSLRGVGLKTANCVLIFSLGLPALPVDTHVYRVSRRLGLIGARVSVEAAHGDLEARVRPEDRYRFHLHLIEHGRRVCHARKPACRVCILNALCPSACAA